MVSIGWTAVNIFSCPLHSPNKSAPIATHFFKWLSIPLSIFYLALWLSLSRTLSFFWVFYFKKSFKCNQKLQKYHDQCRLFITNAIKHQSNYPSFKTIIHTHNVGWMNEYWWRKVMQPGNVPNFKLFSHFLEIILFLF